jgi:lipid A ethanolaminephosphotransferase
MVLTCNSGYWSLVAGAIAEDPALPWLHLVSFALLTYGLMSLILLILAFGPLARLVLAVLLPVAAAAGFFTSHYGTLIDNTMLVNVIETNATEAVELVSFPLLVSIIILGIVPAIAVLRYQIPARSLPRALAQRVIGLVIATLLFGIPLLTDQREIFSLARNHRELRHMIAPLDAIDATVDYLDDRLDSPHEHEAIALDARHAGADGESLPTVHVLVIGETARAANFSLNGYPRTTNPELATHTLYSFREAASCGTATAQSVPCMFSVQTMRDFDSDQSRYQDNLLDIAARSGYDVRWIDNGNSCKDVCARVQAQDLSKSGVDELCTTGDRCYDGILVEQLRQILQNADHDMLIVLHQLGSHGPAYYRRYPDEFRRFTPDCRSDDLGQCTSEEIVNSYDNTILYTDHVVAQAIDALDEVSDRLSTSLVYVSDHGESLGEHNLYLHGMPRALAPEEQTHIPLLTWFSRNALISEHLQQGCKDAIESPSHDNLFHTELGLLGIDTAVYRPELDLLSGCRNTLTVGRTARVDLSDS